MQIPHHSNFSYIKTYTDIYSFKHSDYIRSNIQIFLNSKISCIQTFMHSKIQTFKVWKIHTIQTFKKIRFFHVNIATFQTFKYLNSDISYIILIKYIIHSNTSNIGQCKNWNIQEWKHLIHSNIQSFRTFKPKISNLQAFKHLKSKTNIF